MFPHPNHESLTPGFMSLSPEYKLPKHDPQKYWLIVLLILDEDSRTHADLHDILESFNPHTSLHRSIIVELMLKGYIWDDVIQHGDDDGKRIFDNLRKFKDMVTQEEDQDDKEEGQDDQEEGQEDQESTIESSIFPDGLPRIRITDSGRKFLNTFVKVTHE